MTQQEFRLTQQSAGAALTEAGLLRDIAYYESKAADLEQSARPGRLGLVTVYRYSAKQRRQMLAALKDGRPDAWMEYSG